MLVVTMALVLAAVLWWAGFDETAPQGEATQAEGPEARAATEPPETTPQ